MKNNHINFLDDDIEELSNTTDDIINILVKNNFFVYANLLEDIKKTAESKDENIFIDLVLNNAIWGGSGALWEIYINNINDRYEFNKLIIKYINIIEKIGINNERIDQIKNIFNRLI